MQNNRMPPLVPGEIVPTLKVVKVDSAGVAQPQHLTMLTCFRYTEQNWLHALAKDDATGETVALKASEFMPHRVQMHGRSHSKSRLYRRTDAVEGDIRGSAKPEQLALAGVLRRGDHARFEEALEARAADKGVELIRTNEQLPADHDLLLHGITTDRDYHWDRDNRDWREEITVESMVVPANQIGQTLYLSPAWKVFEGMDAVVTTWYAVDLGPSQGQNFSPNFNAEECGKPAAASLIAERLRNIATVLKRAADGKSCAQDVRFDEVRNIEPQNYFTDREQRDRLFDEAVDAVTYLATPEVVGTTPQLAVLASDLANKKLLNENRKMEEMLDKTEWGYEPQTPELTASHITELALRLEDLGRELSGAHPALGRTL